MTEHALWASRAAARGRHQKNREKDSKTSTRDEKNEGPAHDER